MGIIYYAVMPTILMVILYNYIRNKKSIIISESKNEEEIKNKLKFLRIKIIVIIFLYFSLLYFQYYYEIVDSIKNG